MKLVLAAGVLTLLGGHALAQPGSAADPIAVHMKRGTDKIVLKGELVQNVDCCTYSFKAFSDQTLIWKLTGPATRVLIQYPDGHTDGPDLPPKIDLPSDGTYLFTVSPNTMADGAFGRFVITMTIPPQVITPGLSVNGDKH